MDELNRIKQVLETALLTSSEPLTAGQLARLFDPALPGDLVRRMIDELCSDWANRGVELVQVATGWRFQSKPELQVHLDRLSPEKPPKYSRSALETLAIIAYRQPVTRADIESIRGVVVATDILRRMEERQWIEVVGHRETPGRPALYATTKTFLDDLGLRSLSELPPLADLDHATQIELTDARQPYTPTLDEGTPHNQALFGDAGSGDAAGSADPPRTGASPGLDESGAPDERRRPDEPAAADEPPESDEPAAADGANGTELAESAEPAEQEPAPGAASA